ncbi:MAG: DUF4249 family protein [Lentimicrobiaceae bacterium]|nr:DUF4249 family protein [Lentimicrobiaceae bacterium]
MNRIFFKIFGITLIIFTFLSCKNDFDLNAEYKEINIVHGILDYQDTTHYLRINKAFLGENSAIEYAKILDSSFINNAVVKIMDSSANGVVEIIFDTITLYNKKEGDFYAPKQIVYKADFLINNDHTYKLIVDNSASENITSAETKPLGNFNFTSYNVTGYTFSINNSKDRRTDIEFSNSNHAKRYKLDIVFHYKELRSNFDTSYSKIKWSLPEVMGSNTSGSGRSRVSFLGIEFYNYCLFAIPYSDPNIENAIKKRLVHKFELTLTAIDENLSIYLDAAKNSGNSIIETPMYTNINNGYGIFASRRQIVRTYDVSKSTEFILTSEEAMQPLKFIPY